MPQIIEASSEDKTSEREPQHTKSTEAKLAEISRRVAAAMEEQGLSFQLFILAGGRDGGITFGTMDNSVSDDDFFIASELVYRICTDVLRLPRLAMRRLACTEVRP